MLVLFSWLKEFVPVDVPVEKLAHDITIAGLEVEGVEDRYAFLDKVICALLEEVVVLEANPSMKLCSVNTGQGSIKVVCGAPNVRPGMMAPLALEGAFLPGDRLVTRARIYGVESQGMLCSEAELGLGEDSSGIMELVGARQPGASVKEFLGLDDWILEIGITPNRSDCLSVAGVARDVAAVYQVPLGGPSWDPSQAEAAGEEEVPVSIEAPEYCFRYMAKVMDGIGVAPSPFWLKSRLEACGVRPINNVVDVTNYVMLEMGQPLHAFDLERLNGPEIRVRRAVKDEPITTLDGKEHRLDESMLVIADASRPVAVAGVMGGANSEVEEGTTRILLESAWFEPSQVRRTAKALKSSTDASYRFERGIDPLGVPKALNRATALLVELAGARVVGESDSYPAPYEPKELLLRPQRVNGLLGTALSPGRISGILEGLSMEVREEEEGLRVEVPSFRPDIAREVDLVEEVARIEGYDKIPTTLPRAEISPGREPELMGIARRVKRIMAGLGLNETISYSFASKDQVASLGFGADDPAMAMVEVMNPLSDDQAVMRTSLLVSLLGAASRNISRRNHEIKMFELGKVFYNQGGEELPREEERLCCIMAGPRHPLSWSLEREETDLFDLKGVMEGLFRALGIDDWHIDKDLSGIPYIAGGGGGVVKWGGDGEVLGVFGQVAPFVLERWDIEMPLFTFDFSLQALATASSPRVCFRPLPAFPPVERDAAIVLGHDVTLQQVLSFIADQAVEYLESVELFDLYKGSPIPEDARSLGLRFRYRASDRTLTDGEVSRFHDPLVAKILETFGGELRQ